MRLKDGETRITIKLVYHKDDKEVIRALRNLFEALKKRTKAEKTA